VPERAAYGGAERRRLDGDEERINRMIEKALAA
jgi:hypothetical protein